MKIFNKIHVPKITIIFISLMFFSGLFKYFLIIFSIVLFHELGHITISLLFKRKISKINIYPFGGYIEYDGYISSNIYEDILISLGGILFQVILSIFIKNDIFNYYNKLIIIFNLIPVKPLDGEKIVNLFISLFIPYKRSLYISIFISILTFILLLTNIYRLYNNTLVLIFILIKNIEAFKNIKYVMNKFYLERALHIFKFNRYIYIDKKENMYKNRINMIDGLREDIYLKKYFE